MLILVHSPKGGSGSSFLAASLAATLARRGQQVAAIDFTFQDTLKLYLGLLPTQPVIEMSARVGEAMVVAGVEIMSGHIFSREQAFIDGIRAGDSPLLDKERIIFADIGSEDRELRGFLLDHAALHICPILPRSASLATLSKVQPGTPTVALEKTVFVLNQLDDRRQLSRHTHNFIRELVGDKLLGTVRYDEAINDTLAMFQPLEKFAPSSALIPDLERLTDALQLRLGLGGSVHGGGDVQKATAQ
ncbi:MAG TPA: division plane positioning ATPase MipZ [Sphingobium sp.]